MKIIKWEQLPPEMQTEEVKKYYDIMEKRKVSLFFKRVFDLVMSVIGLIIFSPVFLVLAIAIKVDSPGPIFYRQERVTQYGKRFRIHKFRTMVQNADKIGTAVTVSGDFRVTKVGRKLRNLRIDELPQLIDVLVGNMSFVGTRPEATKYVNQYSNEMYATLLLPAGITSEASIRYKDEAELLNMADDVDKVYVEQVLPQKMKWNLESIERFRFWRDILTMLYTMFAVLGKEYK